jgi:hypothetical protein
MRSPFPRPSTASDPLSIASITSVLASDVRSAQLKDTMVVGSLSPKDQVSQSRREHSAGDIGLKLHLQCRQSHPASPKLTLKPFQAQFAAFD